MSATSKLVSFVCRLDRMRCRRHPGPGRTLCSGSHRRRHCRERDADGADQRAFRARAIRIGRCHGNRFPKTTERHGCHVGQRGLRQRIGHGRRPSDGDGTSRRQRHSGGVGDSRSSRGQRQGISCRAGGGLRSGRSRKCRARSLVQGQDVLDRYLGRLRSDRRRRQIAQVRCCDAPVGARHCRFARPISSRRPAVEPRHGQGSDRMERHDGCLRRAAGPAELRGPRRLPGLLRTLGYLGAGRRVGQPRRIRDPQDVFQAVCGVSLGASVGGWRAWS